MRKTIEFGKVDYNKSGRRNCMVEVEIELRDTDKGPVFSASGTVWNPLHTDCYMAGQCIDTLDEFLHGVKLYEEIRDLWEKHHLNDMHSGDKEQEAEIKKWLEEEHYDYDYELVCEHLKAYGLYEHNGHEYGTTWLYREIPAEDLERIKKLLSPS